MRDNASEYEMIVRLAQTSNFRAAAAELGMSPSALSHAVAAVEARLGIRLFNRTTRSVSLTEAGEKFVTRVAPALVDSCPHRALDFALAVLFFVFELVICRVLHGPSRTVGS